jgi:hypothetical protein
MCDAYSTEQKGKLFDRAGSSPFKENTLYVEVIFDPITYLKIFYTAVCLQLFLSYPLVSKAPLSCVESPYLLCQKPHLMSKGLGMFCAYGGQGLVAAVLPLVE